ncbi:hypothetical protein [Streptomyces tanashiensis]|uniref:Uncharacterized protein n=1 Tax=Streptomyces tanashiensis TaxID=67367 RepID=A0ABY6R9D2_9ACTN|nr:hypothetical protein [Streptomyces tanashiensis]UZX25524.1 hypothetical protein LDH80_34605 [Streptomyces tanashiensis]GGY26152.1 hypothetical protein GCM10010299_35310 [Streptomyces tanashiensis]
MDPEVAFAGEVLYPQAQPWEVVFDALWVSHSEFWLVAGDGFGADIVTAIPEGDSVRGNGEAIGIPTQGSAGRIAVVLSAWEEPAPDGRGVLLGMSRITAPDRELALVNVEGREPGPVLVLRDEGDHEVKVWRLAPGSDGAVERYDVRVWPCPARG